MPQLITITSEAIQAQIRRLLPSQQGFGIDMEASSVITPVIDITPAAEGSQLPIQLQQAVSASVTEHSNSGGVLDIITEPGFWRFIGSATIKSTGTAAPKTVALEVVSGGVTKKLWRFDIQGAINNEVIALPLDEIVYLQAGDQFQSRVSSSCNLGGSVRQVADVYGNLVNPLGFTFE